jgi:hypothetical protein
LCTATPLGIAQLFYLMAAGLAAAHALWTFRSEGEGLDAAATFGEIGARSCGRDGPGPLTRCGGSGLSAQERGLSRFLAAHPLQVHAGRNQLQSLLVTVTDRESLRPRGLKSTRGAAAHAVRARCGALLDLQVR